MWKIKSDCNLQWNRWYKLLLDIWKYYKCKDIWFRFEAREKTTGIPIHILRNKVGDHLSSLIIKTYVLPGCDVTSKTITKSSAMKNNQESFLDDFGIREPFNAAFESRDKFLVNVIWPSSNYKRFDKLRQEKWRLLTKVYLNCHQHLTHFTFSQISLLL